jgi:hypothetical protein
MLSGRFYAFAHDLGTEFVNDFDMKIGDGFGAGFSRSTK